MGKILKYFCLIFIIQASFSSAKNLKVEDFALLDHKGEFHQLHNYSTSKAVVLFVHGVGCPIVRHHLKTLKQLRSSYSQKGIKFLFLNANPQDEREDIVKEALDFQIDFPILKDKSQLVAQMLHLYRTAEALLISTKDWKILYRGPINDRLGYETQKQKAQNLFLENALENFLKGKIISPHKIPVKGCLINMKAVQKSYNRPISYSKEIVPLLEQKCVSCHSRGGIAPWSMTSHKKIEGWSSTIREVVLTKRMPPWHADGKYGKFLGDRSLSAQQTRTLVHWIDNGSLLDGETDPLHKYRQKKKKQWLLGKPDLVVTLPSQKIPATGVIDYIYVRIAVPIEKDVWVRASDIRPSEPEVMHHALTFIRYPKHLKQLEPRWRDGVNGYFSAYVPGYTEAEFPKGTGQWLPKGSTFIFQLHYTSIGRAVVDTPEMALYFHDKKPQRKLKTTSAVNQKFRIPAHKARHHVQALRTFDKNVLLYGLFPHMHYRGHSAYFEALYPNGQKEILLSVPNYQFNWQTGYFLKQPKRIPAGTAIVFKGVFNNSAQNPRNPDPSKAVIWGDQSWEEMFLGYMRYVEE